MKTITLRWEESVQFEVEVNVPDDFELDDYNLTNEVSELGGFVEVDRFGFEAEDTEFNRDAIELDL
ncbi:hypothetical protein [Nocardia salmonicida]|uniref:hypothetical protein n=1 Tax=Nocardia salmonicida TaxID=53431 RepID=UPI0007A42070|nr:hypothetical protein [Nocardia salmonicida]MBC7303181.1 hypothetical protein [Nocardia sp.]